HFQRLDGSAIESLPVQPGALVPMMAADLDQGRVSRYLANLIPRLAYHVRREAGTSRWILAARTDYNVRNDPDRLVFDGLAFTGSDTSGDLTVFAENRNPQAYTTLAGV